MTAVLATAPSATPATRAKLKPKPVKLSDEQRAEGKKVLLAVPTVERAVRNKYHIGETVDNVFKNDTTNVALVQYLRKVAGYEVVDQRAYVAELLLDCGMLSDEDLQKEAAQEKAA